MSDQSWFKSVVLFSSGLPDKGSYNLREVGQMLGISARHLRAMLHSGTLDLDLVRFHGRGTYRVYRQTLVEFFAKRRQSA